jgi:tetratricopeptide (TPR) repeat protein
MIKNLIIAAQILLLCQMSPGWADDDENTDGENPDSESSDSAKREVSQKTITSMDAYNETSDHTAGSLEMAAEYAYQNGDFEKAIKLCQKALNNDYNDIDIHKTYAEALEDKIKATDDKDHEVLNKCIREWLIVYRTEVGDEKGLSFHGIDPFGYLYRDEDRSMLAGARLQSLAGRVPKLWETDEKYLKWVNRPSTAVAGRIINKPSGKTQ